MGELPILSDGRNQIEGAPRDVCRVDNLAAVFLNRPACAARPSFDTSPGPAALSSTKPTLRPHGEAISDSRSRLPAAPSPGVHSDRLFAWRVLFAIAGNRQQQVA